MVTTGPEALIIENLAAPILFIPSEINSNGRNVQNIAITTIMKKALSDKKASVFSDLKTEKK